MRVALFLALLPVVWTSLLTSCGGTRSSIQDAATRSGSVVEMASRSDTVSDTTVSPVYAPLQNEDFERFHRASPPFFRPPRIRLDIQRLEIDQQGAAKDDDQPTVHTAPGFRVQIIAARDHGNARYLERRAIERYGDSLAVYLIYQAPTYKVQVGDYTSRAEALQAAQRLKQDGFRDAWAVPAVVNVKY